MGFVNTPTQQIAKDAEEHLEPGEEVRDVLQLAGGRNSTSDALVFAASHPYYALVGTNRHLILVALTNMMRVKELCSKRPLGTPGLVQTGATDLTLDGQAFVKQGLGAKKKIRAFAEKYAA
jgi:hypothetical protein